MPHLFIGKQSKSRFHNEKVQLKDKMKKNPAPSHSRHLRLLSAALLPLLALLFTGCYSMSVTEGTPGQKKQALSFSPPPGKAGIYLTRPRAMSKNSVLFNVDLDGEEFGRLEPSSYLFGLVTPGVHYLRSRDRSGSSAPFTAEEGRNYFFSIKPGWSAPIFEPIPDVDGKAQVRQMKLSGF